MNIKPTAALAVSLVGVLALSACDSGGDDGSGTKNGLPEEYSSGVNIPFINYPPYSIVDEDGEIRGIDAAISEALAEYFGVEFKPVTSTFEQSLLGVSRGTYTWAPAASITAERKETYDFVSYFSDRYRLLVKDDAPDIGSEPTDTCGLTVSVTTGGIAIRYLEEFSAECEDQGMEPLTISTFPDQSAVELAVKSGRVDAAAATLANATYVVENSEGLKITGPEYSIQVQGLTLPKGSDLAEPLRDAVNALIEDGTYGEILAEYGVEDAAIEESEINPDTGQ